MVKSCCRWVLFICLVQGLSKTVFSQDTALLVRTLNVADGLPQSFISGLVQDAQGFVWIATRDGLARYDGRRFKVFNHRPGDSTSLATSVIANLYQDKKGNLWIAYESGELDRMNTATERVEHLSKMPAYSAAHAMLKSNVIIVRSFAEDTLGNVWLLGKKGGVFIYNTNNAQLDFYTDSAIGCKNNNIVGLAPQANGDVLLVTDTAFVSIDARHKITQIIPFRFDSAHLYNPKRTWKDSYPIIRKNGEIVLLEENRLLVYHPSSKSFTDIALPFRKMYLGPNVLLDKKDNVFFSFKGIIYKLSPQNELTVWNVRNGQFPESQCMLLDKSGMLWVGGNGSGLQLYDQRLSHLFGEPYREEYVRDILGKYLGVSKDDLANLWKDMTGYALRWAKDKNGNLWVAKSGREGFENEIGALRNGHLDARHWQVEKIGVTDTVPQNINAIAFSESGKLWGIDYTYHPVYFDTAAHKAIFYPQITNAVGANSLVIDGEDVFWISSNFHGLYRFNRLTGDVKQYIPDADGNGFPSAKTGILLQDPADKNKLWIGTLGSGLIHFDKRTGHSKLYTIDNGLPNNTVYTILADAKGRIWGSTNRGIFRLDPTTGNIYGLTQKDGLPGDEFNRFHFLQFPDGRMSFGGVDGYVVFDPLVISEDNFDPEVVITDVSINNRPADVGMPGSPFDKAINYINQFDLPYYSNFLNFEFAALEYNIPEKLQYRYMLEGFDPQWVNVGKNNTAVYTSLPPGHYTLLINATNTAGKWGTKIKRLSITIHPPFWKTWWFFILCFLIGSAIVYLTIYYRLKAIRNEQKKQLQFERQAMELEAQALRAQMNPHFIFNCLNSIKSLIHVDKKQEAVVYLTTFSKLIRNQLENTQKEVSLHDELETCKLYVKLEGLRFGDKIAIEFLIASEVDTHAVMVPPLVIQPFIENAIWHGILPMGRSGKVTISITKENDIVKCAIDDDGVGRMASRLNKPKNLTGHQSKGMQLISDRLNLHSIIYNRGGWLEVEDKKDAQGNSIGTTVVIYFKEAI